MPATYVETIRNKLRAITGTSKISDIDEWAKALAEDIDTKMASWWVDTFAKRPAAGQPNRLFKASDTGAIYHDTGSEWEPIVTLASGAYGGQVARVSGTEYEPNATRPTLVTAWAKTGGSITGLTVGGVALMTPGLGAAAASVTFVCVPKAKFVLTGAELSTSYLTL